MKRFAFVLAVLAMGTAHAQTPPLRLNGVIFPDGTTISTGFPVPAQRSPVRSDSTARGYAVGNTWQASGQTWNAVDVTGAAAVWQPVPYDATPLAQKVGTPLAAYGTVLLVAGYTGAAFKLVRASDSAQSFIFFVQGSTMGIRVADWATVDQFCAGTTCGVNTWYDQSGNGYDLTQATPANQPQIAGKAVNSFRAITFDGWSGSTTDRKMSNVSLPVAASTALSAVMIGRPVSSGGLHTMFEFGSFPNDIEMVTDSTPVGMEINIVAQQLAVTSGGFPMDAAPAVIAWSTGASSVSFYSNDFSATVATTPNALTPTGIMVGNQSNGSRQIGVDMVAAMVFARALTANDLTNLRQGAYQQLGIQPQTRDTLLLMGDSIMEGNSSTFNNGPSNILPPLLTRPYRIINDGIAGQYAVNWVNGTGIPTLAQVLAKNITTGPRNLVAVEPGSNDIQTNSVSAATLEGYQQSLCAMVRAASAKCVLVDFISRTWTGGAAAADETTRLAVNAWDRANWQTFADGFADVGGDAILGCGTTCAANTTYFDSSGVHPTSLGYAYYQQIVAATINAMP